MSRDAYYALKFEKPCDECKGARAELNGKILHDITCSQGNYNKNDLIYSKLLSVKINSRARDNIVVYYDNEQIAFFNKCSVASRWYFEGLRGNGWLHMSKNDLNGRIMYFYDFAIDTNDNGVWADLYCIDWMYKKYGSENIIIHSFGEGPAHVLLPKVKALSEKYTR